MKKILVFAIKTLLTIFASALVVALLLVAIRGVPGNLAPDYIVEHLRTKGMPFELSPERGRFALTFSIAENNSFEFTREIAAMAVPDLATVNNKYVSLFAPGVSIIALPFYYLGKMFELSQVVTFASSTLFAGLNLICIILIVKKMTQNAYAGVAAGLTFLFGTNAWAYSGTLYQHHLTTFLLLLSFYLLLYKRNLLLTILVGILFATAIFVEYPNAIFFIPLLLFLLHKYIDITEVGEKIRLVFNFGIISIVLGVAVGLVPLIWYNVRAYNNPLQLAGTLKSVRTLEATDSATLKPQVSYKQKTVLGFFKLERVPGGLDVLLTSKDRGLLVYAPVILLGFLGFIPLFKKRRPEAYVLLGTTGIFFALYSMWGDPWGGWAFGPRYMIPTVALLAVPLGVAIHAYGRSFWFGVLYVILLNYSLAINAVGALTTIQIPPSVEHDALLLPKLTYLHNFELLYQGISNSYIFKTFLFSLIPLHVLASIMMLSVSWLTALMYLLAQKKSASKN